MGTLPYILQHIAPRVWVRKPVVRFAPLVRLNLLSKGKTDQTLDILLPYFPLNIDKKKCDGFIYFPV